MEATQIEEELTKSISDPPQVHLVDQQQLQNGAQLHKFDKTDLKDDNFQIQNNQKQVIEVEEKDEQIIEQINKEISDKHLLPTETKSETINKSELHKDFKQNSEQLLRSHKLLKKIFIHFCQQNHLVSIKSTLFQDKQRQMELMTLSKWMILNKQYSVYEKLSSIKGHPIQQSMSNSQVNEQRGKVIKIVQKNTIQIFRKGTNNSTKMNFEYFCQAILLLFQQFKPVYEQSMPGLNKFLSEVFYCSSSKDCHKKLSSLKMTSKIPQIDYQRPVTILSNSRTNKNYMFKQNQPQNTRTQLTKSRSMLTHDYPKLSLNPVIRQAKNTVQNTNNYSSYMIQKQSKHLKLRPQQINQNPLNKPELKKDLINFFQMNRDDILESYFSSEKTQNIRK